MTTDVVKCSGHLHVRARYSILADRSARRVDHVTYSVHVHMGFAWCMSMNQGNTPILNSLSYLQVPPAVTTAELQEVVSDYLCFTLTRIWAG
jgi:hypothetical protein